jgi:hypothetical protein
MNTVLHLKKTLKSKSVYQRMGLSAYHRAELQRMYRKRWSLEDKLSRIKEGFLRNF